jgi:hypothetical protein
MNKEQANPQSGDGWIPGSFHENRVKFPLEELIPYAGKYVAWSLDGRRIIASAATEEALYGHMDQSGIPSTHYVVGWIDPLS